MTEKYIIFDEYIHQGEPAQCERADAWRVAIGLQAVDGLKVSNYLLELARKNIEGELTIDEVRDLLDQHYEEKRKRNLARRNYETYTKIEIHPNPEEAKMGRQF